jgi:hypothetical protein
MDIASVAGDNETCYFRAGQRDENRVRVDDEVVPFILDGASWKAVVAGERRALKEGGLDAALASVRQRGAGCRTDDGVETFLQALEAVVILCGCCGVPCRLSFFPGGILQYLRRMVESRLVLGRCAVVPFSFQEVFDVVQWPSSACVMTSDAMFLRADSIFAILLVGMDKEYMLFRGALDWMISAACSLSGKYAQTVLGVMTFAYCLGKCVVWRRR